MIVQLIAFKNKRSTLSLLTGSSLPRYSRRGFTLTELLVVIVIIAVLAAIIFPVFARAKEAGYRAGATSNVKQIGLAHIMYEADNDEQFVLYFSGYVPNDPTGKFYYPPLSYWPQTLSSYLGTSFKGPGQALIQDLPKVFVDPKKGLVNQDPSLWSKGNISSWGMSDDIAQWLCPTGIPATFLPVNPSSVVAPAECIQLTETWDYYSPNHNLAGSAIAASFFDSSKWGGNGAASFLDSPYSASFSKTAPGQEADPKGRNVSVFCDGHVAAILTGKLTRDGSYWSIGNNDAWP
jgi:prepilin-type N-terminal cleavage/methylation domain-containing protein